ncbi:MAG: DsbA family protein [Nitrosopumilus sp.]|nr:DsbA family protein [Nitrosopumilus sp.]
MKNILFVMIFGLFAIGLISSSVVFGGNVNSPHKQMAMGVAAEDVICKSGFDLMLRSSGTAACVTPSTAMKLELTGWGTITKTATIMDDAMQDETMKDTMEDGTMNDTMEDVTMDDTMENGTIDDTVEIISAGGIDVTMAAPLEGSTNAPITIIEFGDFQCPKCDQWFQNEKPTIVSNYIETGMAKLYFLDLTWLGEDSISASQATYCAEDQGMYWQYHTHLYNNQRGIEDGWANTENLKVFAEELGLDTEKFNECLDSGMYSKRVSHNNTVGAFHNVDATPTFFIIGADGSIERINGPQPASVFDEVIKNLS